ncbi:recombinase family protein [uncultured Mitsuokella sp.]|uniref:recombinase family protein n=1 Tax=uncultured Mitsuokella sp. TaxID=453120 RepID=UPI0025943CDB|nr:recombinase family protein [uncultured Mitsuokella sp.]
MPSRTAIYIRVSTQEQATEGYSIQAQTERLQAYCKAKGWGIFHIYTDAGFSGSNMERPALSQLLNDVEAGRVDCVLVYKLDRLSRSQKDTLHMIEDVFLDHGCDFVSMSENFDTSTPLGRAMIGILSVFAQLEREQIRERMAIGRTERAKSGLWQGGGWIPIGYDYVDGRLVPNPIRAAAVRDIYNLFLSGTPITSIKLAVNKKYALDLSDTTVHSVLSHRLYVGDIVWRGEIYKGQHEPLIDMETFARAQKLLHSRARIAASKPDPFKPRTLLGGLLFCENCGARYLAKGNYSGHGDRRVYRPYYMCYSRAKSNKRLIIDPTCRNPAYAVVSLDHTIIEEIRRIASDPQEFDAIVAAGRPDAGQKRNRNAEAEAAIMHRLDEIDANTTRLLDLYQRGLAIDKIAGRLDALDKEKATLQDSLQELRMEKKAARDEEERLGPERAHELMGEFLDAVDGDADLDTRRKLLGALIEKIIVKRTPGDFDIYWTF